MGFCLRESAESRMDEDKDLIVVREALNREKVKLWLPPYLEVDGSTCIAQMQTLADDLSSSLKLPQDKIIMCLATLQQKALENLKERDKFQATGVAALKIRSPSKAEAISINIKLSENGSELKRLIAESLSEPLERLKIIGKGKVLVDDEPLEKQNIKHGMQLMALLLGNEVEELKAFEKKDALLNSTKKDIDLLTGEFSPDGGSYLQIADQSGKPLSLPPHEQKALVLAMTLHEKGRAAMKKENYSLALFLLLEAEKEFRACNSTLLKQVDNYGVLNLDVAWCYLCLQSINQLPDAETRLETCEQVFHKTYGSNLERLRAVKGSTGSESALFLRLHLLQAIVNYHKNKFDVARNKLEQVEVELRGLKVNDEQLTQLLELGYKLTESRVALRDSAGNINIAVSIIENKRAERKKIDEAARKERELNKERKKLGKCKDGSWVEPEFVKALVSMGYSRNTAKMALSETNNKISDAVALIQEFPDRLPLPPVRDDDKTIEQLIALGFNREIAADVLKRNSGNINSALDELVSSGGLPSASSFSFNVSDPQPSTSFASLKEKVIKKAEKMKGERDAYSRVAEGIDNSADDYLDLVLTTEEQFLQKYKELLSQNTGNRLSGKIERSEASVPALYYFFTGD